VTPLGKKSKKSSVAMASDIPVPAEIDAENIARPKLEQLLAEDQKAIEEIRRKIR
jgi:hypothetical protein